ncbi:hypothetical protein [uncultured Subdoligranulum sp.]|uniref:hypothetical protein n=1 Tax=uncultured Subdoligranulum sp. TaxID=512298 RepID=UPI0025F4F379|nr:hypothetical protein [uncultured Subdoligranulum sp.]
MGYMSAAGGTLWEYEQILYIYIHFQGGYSSSGPIPEHTSFIIENGATKNDDSNSLSGCPIIKNPMGYAGFSNGYDDMSSFGALKLEAKTGQNNAKFTSLSNLICVYGTTKGKTYTKGEQFVLTSGFYGFAKK